VSQLRDGIARVIHQYLIEQQDLDCDSEPAHVYQTGCEHLADAIVTQLDWPDVDR
jgi:hypothetical protein